MFLSRDAIYIGKATSLCWTHIGQIKVLSLPQIDRMTVEEIKDMVRSATGITEFQRRVYLALLDVPKGSLITYGELALKVGCKSPRAVGNALHKNPFAPLVPCHRVVRANGEIGGYAFGEQEKLRLLREEARDCFGCGFRDKW